ncbi:flavodoxin-dependent (E)-4-hydroxy-3-methylbut-2-enyl-diphosphate synthase [Candidatus Peregrinibacteria bacterium]|jgi:(E)-4-hydroxy-3-methylbut-2-enyl-diphosphate synthase|nr:flavodoxin-dependent (E)-4-hydroxy-3-methylbut-2-enyl-diphosphate synthase [Candidatus Peregrinibacteria bacterium]
MKKLKKEIRIGNIVIGGENSALVQSMCNTDTRDISSTVKQILELEAAGCEIIRVTVPDMKAAEALSEIKRQIHIPLVADIHFDYRLALKSIEQGVDKIRINPGNIGKKENIEKVVNACKEKNIPIRIGVNGGSLEKDILHKYHDKAPPEALVESALRHVKILEDLEFYNIVISVKASNVLTTLGAYRLLHKKIDYPLHLGVTEAGTLKSGTVKSCLGLGTLLEAGIGDTLRVSLTADPVEEVKLAWSILKNLGLRERGIEFTSCPGCGRTEINLQKIAMEVEEYAEQFDEKLHIAIMGCVVNGPGEAAHADIGLIGAKGRVAIYEKGKFLLQESEENAVSVIKKLIDKSVKKR